MAWTGSDGSEHNSQYDRDFNEKVNLGREPEGGYGGMDKGTALSGHDIEIIKVIIAFAAPITMVTIALYGLFAPFRVMLRDFYLIYIPISRIVIVCFIVATIITLLSLDSVIFPFIDRRKMGAKKVLLVILGAPVLVAGLLNSGASLFGDVDPINNNLDTRWRNSFYSFGYAKVSADGAVLRAAPSADAKAVLTLERGEEFAIFGDVGSGWYFVRQRTISDNIRNYGYVRADSVTLDNPRAELQAMRPAALLVDGASIHRARRWQSWQRDLVDKSDYVLAAGESRGGWTPVYTANAESWSVGYMNDALLFFADDNSAAGSGAEIPAEPQGVGTAEFDNASIIFFYGNERYHYTSGNGSDRMNYMRTLPAERYTEVPAGGRVIYLEEETKKQMAPVVYNGRMGWSGWLDWKRLISADTLLQRAEERQQR